jgi:hypothetical protein
MEFPIGHFDPPSDQSGYGTVKVNCYFSCLVNTPNSEMLQISSNIPVPLAGGHGYSN